MATSGAVRAGRAFIELFVDDKTQAGLREARAKLVGFGSAVAKIGAGTFAAGASIVAPLLLAAKRFADVGSEIFDATQRLGIAAEAFSEIAFAAGQAGASTQDVEKAMRKMQVTIADATNGLSGAQDALAIVGLTAADLAGLSVDQQFERIAEAISQIQDPAQKTAAAMDLLGKAGPALLPFINDGADGIRRARAEAQRLGLTVSQIDAAAADRLGDAFGLVVAQIDKLVFAIGGAVAPILSDILELAQPILAAVIQFVQQNRRLVVTTLAVGAGIAALGAVLAAVGIGIVAAGFALAGLGAAVGAVTGLFATLGTVAAAAFALISSPVVLITAAIVGVGVAVGVLLARLRGSFTGIFTGIEETFGQLIGTATSTIEGVVAALRAGRIELAFRIVMAGVQQAFYTSLAKMHAALTAFMVRIASMFASLTDNQRVGLEVAAAFHTAFAQGDLAKLIEEAKRSQQELANELAKARAVLPVPPPPSTRGRTGQDVIGQRVIGTFNATRAPQLTQQVSVLDKLLRVVGKIKDDTDAIRGRAEPDGDTFGN